jgi:hypothetical protein
MAYSKLLASAVVMSAFLSAFSNAAHAQNVSGNVTIQNSTSAMQNRTGLFGPWDPSQQPPSSISAGSSGSGAFSFPSGGVMVGDVTYRDPVTTKGCNFRFQTQKSGSICSVVPTASPIGVSGGTQATCTAIVNSVNSSTCAFSATARISGF